jgi:hypothetical protein
MTTGWRLSVISSGPIPTVIHHVHTERLTVRPRVLTDSLRSPVPSRIWPSKRDLASSTRPAEPRRQAASGGGVSEKLMTSRAILGLLDKSCIFQGFRIARGSRFMKSARSAKGQHFLARHCAVASKMPLVSRAQGPCRTQKRAWNM